jgi:hypothetical protein
MEFHYGKHHASYVTNINNLIKGTEYEHAHLEEIIRKANQHLLLFIVLSISFVVRLLLAVSSTMLRKFGTTHSSGAAWLDDLFVCLFCISISISIYRGRRTHIRYVHGISFEPSSCLNRFREWSELLRAYRQPLVCLFCIVADFRCPTRNPEVEVLQLVIWLKPSTRSGIVTLFSLVDLSQNFHCNCCTGELLMHSRQNSPSKQLETLDQG